VLALDPASATPRLGTCGTLEVGAPAPAAGFATARMVYQREAHRLEPFAYSRWAEPPAPMVQAALVDGLERSGLFAAVLAAPAAVPPDLRLESDELRVVQQFDGEASHVEISLDARLVDLHRPRLLAAQRLSASVPAAADPGGGVAAANRALAELVDDLVAITKPALDCGAASPASD
jgi:ABC-type uncharacterized transport system auxiliary subunit